MFLNEYIDENFITKKPEHFNFAFDVVDRFAIEEPEKKALVWCDDHGNEKILTFSELAKQVNKTANVLKTLGIKKGDSVMLMLRRRYEFWYMLLALHKIGAIAVPATVQLLPSDITYRIEKANIKMVVALNEENVISHIEESIYDLKEKYFDNRKVPQLMLANGNKDGWINFERLFENASSDFADSRCSENEDICVLYFTSGRKRKNTNPMGIGENLSTRPGTVAFHQPLCYNIPNRKTNSKRCLYGNREVIL